MSRPLALLILLLVFLGLPAAAQLDGQFSLSKASYSAGEPVYLVFEVKNDESEPVWIKTGDPLSFCGGYKIEVEGAKRQDGVGCHGGVGGSCASSGKVLGPGETHVDRILLNRSYDLRRPGRYSLHVSHDLPYGPDNANLATLGGDAPYKTFQADLEIVLQVSSEVELKAEFEKYAEDLHSSDWQRKREAALVIANLAPPFLEDTIIHMLDSPELLSAAVRGLYSLGTPAAHDALANFVKTSPPSEPVGPYQEAIRYLGEMRNHEDATILLQVAHKNANGGFSQEAAIEAAGTAGGDDAVPLLVDELRDPSIDVRQSAVRALYLTGSRDAVPVLIGLLLSPEERVSGTAEFGLQVLTHLTVEAPKSTFSPAASYAKWTRWWNAHRASATIFKYDECGSLTQLE